MIMFKILKYCKMLSFQMPKNSLDFLVFIKNIFLQFLSYVTHYYADNKLLTLEESLIVL